MTTTNITGTPARLCQTAVGTTSTTLYTAQNSGRTLVSCIHICNTTNNKRTISLCHTSISTGTAILYDYDITGNNYLNLDLFHIMNKDEVIVASASDTGLTITLSGMERI
jgi:hypothetical protein